MSADRDLDTSRFPVAIFMQRMNSNAPCLKSGGLRPPICHRPTPNVPSVNLCVHSGAALMISLPRYPQVSRCKRLEHSRQVLLESVPGPQARKG